MEDKSEKAAKEDAEHKNEQTSKKDAEHTMSEAEKKDKKQETTEAEKQGVYPDDLLRMKADITKDLNKIFMQGFARAFDEFGKLVETRLGAIESKIGMSDVSGHQNGESDND